MASCYHIIWCCQSSWSPAGCSDNCYIGNVKEEQGSGDQAWKNCSNCFFCRRYFSMVIGALVSNHQYLHYDVEVGENGFSWSLKKLIPLNDSIATGKERRTECPRHCVSVVAAIEIIFYVGAIGDWFILHQILISIYKLIHRWSFWSTAWTGVG